MLTIMGSFKGEIIPIDGKNLRGSYDREQTIDLGYSFPLGEFGRLYQQEQWNGLQTIVVVLGIRHLWNKITHDIQFYLISLPANAQFLSHAICTHWSVKIIFIGQSM